jgi:hypothetical protein
LARLPLAREDASGNEILAEEFRLTNKKRARPGRPEASALRKFA